MRIIYFIAFCLILISQSSWSQPCLPGTTYFNTQQEIDDFQTNYPNCTEIEGFVLISGGDITNLNGLSVLTSVGDFWLQNMGSLTSLDGLHNITMVKGTLYINNVPLLSDMSALSSLTYIGNRLWFWNNSSVTSIESLSNVMSIGRVDIFNNDALTSLSGIDNIDVDSIRDVYIADNDQLTLCEVLSICNYLNTMGADIIIENNAPGCNSPQEVLDSCGSNAVIIDDLYVNDYLELYPNPARQKLNISCEEYSIQEVNMYTLTGTHVLAIRPEGESIDISALRPGMYIVEVMVEGRKVRKKLVVE